MRMCRRRLLGFWRRLLDGSNYRAIPRFLEVHEHAVRILFQDVFSLGTYPRSLSLRTPIGPAMARLYSPADLSTLDMVFCRQDYYLPSDTRVVVDVGSNIGLSSLFWLTRHPETYVYCFEPSPKSYERLVDNLRPYEGRFTARHAAISDFRGTGRLGIEPSGVNSSLDLDAPESVECEVVHINDVLEPVLRRHGRIDVFKIDSEGHEFRTLSAIPPATWERIRCVNVGCRGAAQFVPREFSFSQVGSAERYWREDGDGR